ncbi:MAG: DUF3365 domain-containing protein [Acidobacteriota bacterium]
MVLTAVILAAGPLLAQATPLPISAPSPDVERAKAAARALTTELMGRLTRELAAGGPTQAVRVCSEVAQEIARAHSTDGVTVRRVSVKWRNPADRPDAYEAEQLARFEAAHRAGQPLADLVQWVEVGSTRTLRLLRPIVVGKACLACHGEPAALDPAVRKLLAERYPNDHATGYREGDFRGAVSVSVTEAGPH